MTVKRGAIGGSFFKTDFCLLNIILHPSSKKLATLGHEACTRFCTTLRAQVI